MDVLNIEELSEQMDRSVFILEDQLSTLIDTIEPDELSASHLLQAIQFAKTDMELEGLSIAIHGLNLLEGASFIDQEIQRMLSYAEHSRWAGNPLGLEAFHLHSGEANVRARIDFQVEADQETGQIFLLMNTDESPSLDSSTQSSYRYEISNTSFGSEADREGEYEDDEVEGNGLSGMVSDVALAHRLVLESHSDNDW